MKFLAGVHTWEEATELRDYLEAHGIAVYLEDERASAGAGANGHSGINFSIFAALDSQHADALALMQNPAHTVLVPVNIDDFRSHMKDAGSQATARDAILKTATWAAAGALTLAIAIAVLIYATR